MQSVTTQNQLKQAVAKAAIDYVLPKLHSDSVLGIGTGSTANIFIDMLALERHAFKGAVASSDASAARLEAHGIAIFDLNNVDNMAVYVDGADEANPKLHLLKGGGAALTREKIVAACAREFVCIVDQSKWVKTLGAFPLPVEVIPMARSHAARELIKLGGRPVYRQNCVTDNGNIILDLHDLSIADPLALEAAINQIVGVVSNGLFAKRPADILLLGTPQGIEIKNADTA